MAGLREIQTGDREEWLRMLLALHPESLAEDHHPSIEAVLDGKPCDELLPSAVFVYERETGMLGGLLELSLRNYAEGCRGWTPYIETWFVDEDLRQQGVGRALVAAAEDWAREKGYTEIASDTWLDNRLSRNAHVALGYEEVECVVHFRKSLEAH